jgi:hypothetical protein
MNDKPNNELNVDETAEHCKSAFVFTDAVTSPNLPGAVIKSYKDGIKVLSICVNGKFIGIVNLEKGYNRFFSANKEKYEYEIIGSEVVLNITAGDESSSYEAILKSSKGAAQMEGSKGVQDKV